MNECVMSLNTNKHAKHAFKLNANPVLKCVSKITVHVNITTHDNRFKYTRKPN